MTKQERIVFAGPKPGKVRIPDGELIDVPEGWILLKPGDAALTGRVKKTGDYWKVEQKRGRRVFSLGIYASKERIERLRGALEAERSTPEYKRKLEAGRRRRQREEEGYREQFLAALRDFLAFSPCYKDIELVMATAIRDHATPVGSGTVARTKRIPIEERAESAVIAWMRHQTTAYDQMSIRRVKGERRKVRRELAQRSRSLLKVYRDGSPLSEGCPLRRWYERHVG